MEGAISVFMTTVHEVMKEIYERSSGKVAESTDAQKLKHENMFSEVFHGLLEKDMLAQTLRTLHLTALCHAAYRWDKKRRLKKNDFLDFHHAAAGVGYCDVFLTENPLRGMLQQKHLKISEKYRCKIISSVSEAAVLLSQPKQKQ